MPSTYSLNYIELVAAFFGLVCVLLTAKESLWCWPTGIIGVILSGIFYYHQTLYASMFLQFVFLLFCIHGWHQWVAGVNETKLKISRTQKKHIWIIISITLFMFFSMGIFLDKESNDELPYLDSLLTALSFTAQWMMNKKLIESWWIWIPVDLIYTGLHYQRHDYFFFVMYGTFVIFASIGYYLWMKSLKKSQASQ